MIAIPMKVAVSRVNIPVGIGAAYIMQKYDTYDGDYVFTPTQETQTVHTKEKVLLENIIINPIPNNYGLITWNGAIMTVS
jgi:hypothetical protein